MLKLKAILSVECSLLSTTAHRYDFDRLTKRDFNMLWLWRWGDYDPFEYEYE